MKLKQDKNGDLHNMEECNKMDVTQFCMLNNTIRALNLAIWALSQGQGNKSNDVVTKPACTTIGSLSNFFATNSQNVGRKESMTSL